MAASGYLYVQSLSVSAVDAVPAPLITTRYPRGARFGSPTNAGTLSIIHALLHKRGTPPGNILFEIWDAGSANWFSDVLSGNNWNLITTGSLDPSSVTGVNSPSNATWVPIPVTPVYMDSMTSGIFSNEQKEKAFRYVLKVLPTAAGSTNDSANAVQMNLSTVHNFGFGTSTRSGDYPALAAAANDWEDFAFALSGVTTVSSKFRDRPMNLFTVGSTYIDADLIGDSTFRNGMKFTAVGSSVTRGVVDLSWDGTVNLRVNASIWTHQVNSNLPDTAIASSQLVIVNSSAGFPSNFFDGDGNDASIPPVFVFSGCNVVSGTNYWFAVEVASYANAATTKVSANRNLQSAKRAFWDIRSTGYVSGVESSGFFFELWYVDSETNAIGATDHGAPVSGGDVGGAGYYSRSFPNTYQRKIPELIGRKFPL